MSRNRFQRNHLERYGPGGRYTRTITDHETGWAIVVDADESRIHVQVAMNGESRGDMVVPAAEVDSFADLLRRFGDSLVQP